MKPTLGRFVHYTLTAEDAAAINKRRGDAQKHLEEHRANPFGVVLHVGTDVTEGEVFPMLVTRVLPAPAAGVNGTVFLDGNDTFWREACEEGTEPGTYAWPKTDYPKADKARLQAIGVINEDTRRYVAEEGEHGDASSDAGPNPGA